MNRLDKILSDSGRFTRSEARTAIRAGRVTVNGKMATKPEEKYEAEAVEICADGAPLVSSGSWYFMLHKPAGILSATEDPKQKTVMDLLRPEHRRLRLFPVGRLDKDTTGLLLLTNDGDFAHRVISPRKHVSKRYRAELDCDLNEKTVCAFAEGVQLEDGTKCLPAQLQIPEPKIGIVTVYEGKYHQVKRMYAACGCHVLRLHRESIGALYLDPGLQPGEYRALSDEELQSIFESPL